MMPSQRHGGKWEMEVEVDDYMLTIVVPCADFTLQAWQSRELYINIPFTTVCAASRGVKSIHR